jgi:hypothetical protein
MSCGGNRFECALRKNSRLSTQSDRPKEAYGRPKEAYGKPSNLELYNENQKRLNELLRAREEIDNQYFKPIPTHESIPSYPQSMDCLLQESITFDDIEMNPTTATYTPWVVPSATKK